MIPKISIIVPFYHVKDYLAQCVRSLQNQSLQPVEILLVDDGSRDGSGALAEELACRDDRIRLIHQEHAGLGPARNAGLALAGGEYVAFVDGDDWVEVAMYENLYHVAKTTGAEIVVSGHRDLARGKVLAVYGHPLQGERLSGEALGRARMRLYGPSPEDSALPVSVCMSLYRRDWLETRGLRFRNILSEDVFFNLDAYGCADTVVFTGGTDYCYRKEGQPSITQSFSPEKQARYTEFLGLLLEQAETEGCALRAKGTALGIVRMYAGQLLTSGGSVREQKNALKAFLQQPELRRCREGYPLAMLPLGQRIFQLLLDYRLYTPALACCRLRQWRKERRWKP